MKRKGIFVLILLGFFLLSICLPYLLLPIRSYLNCLLRVVDTEIPAPNYVQGVASLFSFFTSTIIGYSVFFLNSTRDIESRRQDAYELYSYITDSILTIRKYCDYVADLYIEPKPAAFGRILFNLELSEENIRILSGIIASIRKIQRSATENYENKSELCKSFIDDDRLPNCEKILSNLKKKYLCSL